MWTKNIASGEKQLKAQPRMNSNPFSSLALVFLSKAINESGKFALF